MKVWVHTFRRGSTEVGRTPHVTVCMHLGPSVDVRCRRGGTLRTARAAAGDLDIIPAGTASAWETLQGGATLIMCVPDALLRAVAIQLDLDPGDVEIADRFRVRDPVIEHIGWTLKADIDGGSSGGRVLRAGLGTALAVRLLRRHYRGALPMREVSGGLRRSALARVLAYIDGNLAGKLSLTAIAAIAGVSVSHIKDLFRRSTGMPVYQYVLRRRVQHAQLLLRDSALSITDVALATGFAHQSHLSRHMRRILGATPTVARAQLVKQPVPRGVAVPGRARQRA